MVDADVQYALRQNHQIHMTGFITLGSEKLFIASVPDASLKHFL